MALHSWTLTDVARDLYVEHLALGPDQFAGSLPPFSILKRTLRGGLRDGVDVVEVDNGAFRFTVLPTRGMGLWKARAGELPIGWKSPVTGGPVHPKFVPVWEPSGIGWLSGFDELLVRCGLESNGAPEFDAQGRVQYPLHGRIANLPAHKLEVTFDDATQEIAVSGEVDESRLFSNKLRLRTTYRTRLGEPGLRLTDEITNLAGGTSDLELLYHINIGAPLVGPGARISAPIQKLVPRTPAAVEGLAQWDVYGPEQLAAPEQVYFTTLAADTHGKTLVVLASAAADRGVSLHFDTRQLPLFIVWKNPQLAPDGYVTGLEPAINFPNPKSFEAQQGRVKKLAPGERFVSEIRLETHGDSAGVRAAQQAVAKLAAGVTPQISSQPTPDWVAS